MQVEYAAKNGSPVMITEIKWINADPLFKTNYQRQLNMALDIKKIDT